MLLALESSCDETAAAICTADGVLLASAIASQIEIHRQYGGVVPEVASRNHVLHVRPLVEQVLAEKAMRKMLAKIHKKAELVPLPENLMERIRDTFQDSPAIPWDTALANIVRQVCRAENDARTKAESI